MTQERLEALRSLRRQAQQLQEQLRNLPAIQDSVRGSMIEYPYIERRVVVSGVDELQGKRLRKQLQTKLEKIQEEIEAMELWLNEVDDAQMRMILRLRYRNGLSWQKVAVAMGHYDVQYPRRKCKKFMDQLKNDENDEFPMIK